MKLLVETHVRYLTDADRQELGQYKLRELTSLTM